MPATCFIKTHNQLHKLKLKNLWQFPIPKITEQEPYLLKLLDNVTGCVSFFKVSESFKTF